MNFVDKLGGAASKDAASVKNNAELAAADDELLALVTSGPGGTAGRVTERALEWVSIFRRGVDPGSYEFKSFELGIFERLKEQAEQIGPFAVRAAERHSRQMREGLLDGRGAGWVVNGPERYQAEVYAGLLRSAGRNAEYVDAGPWIRRDRVGAIDLELSAHSLTRLLKPGVVSVVPGTPGVGEDLAIVPVTPERRGYTDVTAFVVADTFQKLLKDQVTLRIKKDDVPGILRMPPGLGRDPEIATSLNIVEAEILTRGGSQVVHPTVLELMQGSDAAVLICSGKAGAQDGTTIERNRRIDSSERIVGMAVQEAVAYTVKDIAAEHMTGVVADIHVVFRDSDVSVINTVSGNGIITTYVSAADYERLSREIIDMWPARHKSGLSIAGAGENDKLSIVTFVGEAMSGDVRIGPSVLQEAIKVAYDSGIGVSRHWFSPGRNALYLTLPTEKAKQYMAAAYDHFFC